MERPVSGPIPFSQAYSTGTEIDAMRLVMASRHLAGGGPFTRGCETFLQDALGIERALLTTSCTHALEMAALLLRLRPGDEVIVPSFTFVSTANAFLLHGARIVFADVRPDTLNIDERELEQLITPRTRAIVPVHYAGVGCEMDDILAIAHAHKLTVIEDNAHGLFGRYKGRYLGSFGALATQSFHDTKNFTCGEGGALLVNDHNLIERAEIILEKGTDRTRFFLGLVDKYSWRDVGSSYLPSALLAAFLMEQLSAREHIQGLRKNIFTRYEADLAAWAARNDVRTPTVPAHCEQAYHMYYLVFPTPDARVRYMAHMKADSITTPFHYLPLHRSPMAQSAGGPPGDCPMTDAVAERLVRLPFFNDMTGPQQDRVIARTLDFAV